MQKQNFEVSPTQRYLPQLTDSEKEQFTSPEINGSLGEPGTGYVDVEDPAGEDLPAEFRLEPGETVPIEPEITFSFTHGSREMPPDKDEQGNLLYKLHPNFEDKAVQTRLSDFATVGDAEKGIPGIAQLLPESTRRVPVPNYKLQTDGNRDGSIVTMTGDEGVAKADELVPLVDLGGKPIYEIEPSRETIETWAKDSNGAEANQKYLKKMLRDRIDNEKGLVVHVDVHDGRDYYIDGPNQVRVKTDAIKGENYIGVPLTVVSDKEGKASAPGFADKAAKIATDGWGYLGVEPGKKSETGARRWPDVRANDPYKGKAIMDLVVELKAELRAEGREDDANRLLGFQHESNASLYGFIHNPLDPDGVSLEGVSIEAQHIGYIYNTLIGELREQKVDIGNK